MQRPWAPRAYMSYSLNSLKQVIQWIAWEGILEVIKGDTRSLEYSSHRQAQTLRNCSVLKTYGFLTQIRFLEPLQKSLGFEGLDMVLHG